MRMDVNEETVRLIVIVLVFVFSALSAIVKKLNQWLNERRIKASQRRIDESQRRAVKTIMSQPTSAIPTAQATPDKPVAPAGTSIAEEIMRQMEAMLPPEVAEARRKAREEASSRNAAPRVPAAPVAPAPSAPVAEKQTASAPAAPAPIPAPDSRRAEARTPLQPKVAPPRRLAKSLTPAAALAEQKLLADRLAQDSPGQKQVKEYAAYERNAPRTRSLKRSPAMVRLGVQNKSDLRKSLLWHEILQPPVSLR